VRLTQRQYDAESIKRIDQATWKKDDKTWQQCERCGTWLYEEVYFKANWFVGPADYSEYHCYPYSTGTHRVCTECCPTTLAVVDYLTELAELNAVAYKKSWKKYEREQKKKDAQATCVVDGKTYEMTFKETK
jgi:hypothetical protein